MVKKNFSIYWSGKHSLEPGKHFQQNYQLEKPPGRSYRGTWTGCANSILYNHLTSLNFVAFQDRLYQCKPLPYRKKTSRHKFSLIKIIVSEKFVTDKIIRHFLLTKLKTLIKFKKNITFFHWSLIILSSFKHFNRV